MKDYKSFKTMGNYLRYLRQRKRFSARMLSELIGVSLQNIFRFEKGITKVSRKIFGETTLPIIAKSLNCPEKTIREALEWFSSPEEQPVIFHEHDDIIDLRF